MALRTKEEIEAKILELRKSANGIKKEMVTINAAFLLTVLVFCAAPLLAGIILRELDYEGIAQGFILASLGSFVLMAVTYPILYPIIYFTVIKKLKTLSLKRNMIANELEIVLKNLEKPDAEQTLIHILDWMIVKRSEAKPTLMKKMDFKPGEKPGLARFRHNRFDAAVQAYTWAISAGQDLREKPEEN